MPPRAKRVIGAPIKAPEPVRPPPPETPVLIQSEEPVREADLIESVELPSRTATPDPKESAPSDISCPICEEHMVSLHQLNRHLDDEHAFGATGSPPPRSTESSPLPLPGDELRSWLRKTNDVKTKLQATLPRKFVNLDIFDNGTPKDGGLSPNSRTSSSTSVNAPAAPEITVTRKHWQRPSAMDVCAFPGCKKQLSIKNGVVNCRKCGLLFCHQHTNYRVKLDAEAHYNHKGVWCRCCETCFEKKPGHNDLGLYKDLTGAFKEMRQKRTDERQLYQNKLEKRVANLTAMLNKVDKEFHSSEFNSNFLQLKISSKKRQVEQQLVTWEDGAHVLNCFLCLRNFSFTLRKHHCRLCGRVVCGDETTGCSMEVPINHLTTLLDVPRVNDPSLLRMCRHCKDVLFLKRNFQQDLKKPLSPLLEKFETQCKLRHAIEVLMPRFQDNIQRLQTDQGTPGKTLEASKLRRRVVESFALFDKLTKEIVALQCSTRDEELLQQAIKAESAAFIQQNMAPLKKAQATPQKQKEHTKPKFTREEVQAIKKNREELMVLQEQKYLVQDMIETCTKQRRFDEIAALKDNMDELEKSISQLQLELGDEGF